tara:strand:- start:9 stop:446 length:438 start_codon:yes stop_codon:yes gene_type:complete
MRKKNLISSIAFLLIGVSYTYFTYWLPIRTLPHTPGPSFFPWVIAICFLSLSILLLCKNFIDKEEKEEKEEKIFVKKVLVLILLMLIYISLLPFTGFLLITPFFFASFMYLTSEKRFFYITFFSISIPLFIFYLFQNVFSIFLPS